MGQKWLQVPCMGFVYQENQYYVNFTLVFYDGLGNVGLIAYTSYHCYVSREHGRQQSAFTVFWSWISSWDFCKYLHWKLTTRKLREKERCMLLHLESRFIFLLAVVSISRSWGTVRKIYLDNNLSTEGFCWDYCWREICWYRGEHDVELVWSHFAVPGG